AKCPRETRVGQARQFCCTRQLVRVENRGAFRGHVLGHAIGVIVHGDVEQIEERQPWSALDLQEPPESSLVLLPQMFLGNGVEKTEIESDRPNQANAFELEPEERMLAPVV